MRQEKSRAKKKEEQKKRNREKAEKKMRDYSREHLLFKFHFRDDKEVAQRIRQGRSDFITGTGWGFFDKFFSFLYALGFLALLDIKAKGYERMMLPLVKLLTTYSLKILLGISSMNQVPFLLFREIALLQMIGFTAQEIKEGICNRGKGKSVPMHKNTLADMLDRLSEEELSYVLNGAASLLVKKGFLGGETFILDATDLPTTEKCQGRGKKKTLKEKWDRRAKKTVEVEEIVYGFKVIVIQELRSKIIVAAQVVKIQEHESKYTLSLLAQAQRNLGSRKIALLLIDNAFMDGVTLWEIKHNLKIDFITRVRTNMDVATDARSFRDQPPSPWVKKAEREKDGLAVVGIAGLTTYGQYGEEEHKKKRYQKDFQANPINCVMVTCWKGKEYPLGKEKVFITSLPIEDPLEIIDGYNLRSLIENKGFRELKQGWMIGHFPMKTEAAARSHTLLTLTMYSLNACFQTQGGKGLAQKGIRRLRTEDMSTIHKLIVFAGDYFGIFDVEEYALIVRAPPQYFVRINPQEVQRRLGLKD